jgi:hypothetical protein
MDILTLLGEDARLQALQYHVINALNLLICKRVGNHSPIHVDVIVVTEIQKFFFGELSTIVGNDRVRDPKTKNDVLDKVHIFL